MPFSLTEKYPASEPCGCDICRAYCVRPGWWTVAEAAAAVERGYTERMMLEVSPDFTLAVLSPAFKGCEANFALQAYANAGCTFLADGKCELHSTGLQPLECRFCHHGRQGQGQACHRDLEMDWKTPVGQRLAAAWMQRTKILEKYPLKP